MRDMKEQNILVEVSKGSFKKKMTAFSMKSLYRILRKKNYDKILPMLEGLTEEDAKQITETLVIHEDQILVSKSGIVVIIASATVDNAVFD